MTTLPSEQQMNNDLSTILANAKGRVQAQTDALRAQSAATNRPIFGPGGILDVPFSEAPAAIAAAIGQTVMGGASAAVKAATGFDPASWHVSISGVVSIVLGLILIVAGIMFLRPAQTVIATGAKKSIKYFV